MYRSTKRPRGESIEQELKLIGRGTNERKVGQGEEENPEKGGVKE